MVARRSLRRTLPLVLLGAAATVMLRQRLMPRPALPPGPPGPLDLDGPDPLAVSHGSGSHGPATGRFSRARIDIVAVVDDLLGFAAA